jgi:hypothetical protein
MNLKAKVFKIACHVNFFSIVIFLAIVLVEFGLPHSSRFSNEDVIGSSILFLVLAIYTANFYYGLKLTSRLNKEINTVKSNNTIRVIFFILEILVAIVYSILIYYIIKQIKWSNIWPINNYVNLSRFSVLVCMFSVYLSSLIRLSLTKSVLRTIALHDKQLIELIGK